MFSDQIRDSSREGNDIVHNARMRRLSSADGIVRGRFYEMYFAANERRFFTTRRISTKLNKSDC